MKTGLILSLICLFAAVQGFARTIIISDVDDTLKISHTLNKIDSVENALHIENHFVGMSDLFNSLRSRQGLQFFYVSNALDYIQFLHEEFINFNLFPTGPVLLRERFGDQGHKFRTISKLILKTKPTHIVMIGDNSERDTVIYAQIQKQFPRIKMSTFIHQLYSVNSFFEVGKPLLPGQTAYITAVDLALHLKKLQLLPENSYQLLIERIVPKILQQPYDLYFGEMAFPIWMDCRDFMTTKLDLSTELLVKYAQKIRQRCSHSY